MSNIILIFKDVYNEPIRISADSIESYASLGHYIRLNTKSGSTYDLMCDPEHIDKALSENFFMIKEVNNEKV